MTDWPSSLPPAPLAEGFHETATDTVLRSEMDQGPAKLRRRTTAGVSRMTAGYILSKAQVAALDAFYRVSLSGGSGRFSYTHPRTGAALQVRFRQPPQYTALNGQFFKTMLEFEVMP